MAKRGYEYKPTQPDRDFVVRCVMAGRSFEKIAECLNITVPTLKKHFRYELVTSKELLCGKAAQCLDDAITDGSVDAAKFVLARVAGWAEKQDVTLTQKTHEQILEEMDRAVMKEEDEPESNEANAT